MAEISDPQVTSYCNDYIRTLADKLTTIDVILPDVLALYEARTIGTIVNEAGTINYIDDGSATDGRTRRTGSDLLNMVTLLQNLKAFLDVAGRRDVLVGWQVNALSE